jgi:hypothetical protein
MTRIAPLAPLAPVAPVLCSWCDAPATRNLATALDHACEAHFLQWFGPNLPTVDGADVHPDACPHDTSDATRLPGDTVASAWECDQCGHLRPFTREDYVFCNASPWTPRAPEGISRLAWMLTPREARLAHYAA